MSNKTTQNQKKSLDKLNDLFPLPNPSSGDIKKTFEDMGRTITGGEKTGGGETPLTPTKTPKK